MEALAAENDNAMTVNPEQWPAHVAIIMDGNNRWARAKGTARKLGHKQGAEALKKLVESCASTSMQYLTVYAFSSENWQRSPDEVDDLMSLMRFYLRNEVKHLHKNNIRVAFIGDRTRLSKDIQDELERSEKLTEQNTQLTLIVALSYGSREEIVRSAQRLAGQVANGELKPEEIDEEKLFNGLDTHHWPDPDLLIRTGGDKRLSNFLLWQAAYSELYFCDTLWPDFSYEHMEKAVEDFSTRERRFGARNEAQ